MPVYTVEQPEPTGPTSLRLWMTQREPFIGSTVYVNVEAKKGDELAQVDLHVAVRDPYETQLEYKLQPLDVGLYIVRFQTLAQGLHQVKVWTEDDSPVVEMVDFWVRG